MYATCPEGGVCPDILKAAVLSAVLGFNDEAYIVYQPTKFQQNPTLRG